MYTRVQDVRRRDQSTGKTEFAHFRTSPSPAACDVICIRLIRGLALLDGARICALSLTALPSAGVSPLLAPAPFLLSARSSEK